MHRVLTRREEGFVGRLQLVDRHQLYCFNHPASSSSTSLLNSLPCPILQKPNFYALVRVLADICRRWPSTVRSTRTKRGKTPTTAALARWGGKDYDL